MKVVKETKDKVTYEYYTALERNDHVNSYGLLHTITRIYGDGVKKPLRVEFLKKFN